MPNHLQKTTKTIQQNKQAFKKLGVQKLGVFGSYLHNEHTKTSDIDILVEFNPNQKTYRNYLATAELTEKLFNRPVDLITKKSLSPYIGPKILKEVKYVSLS